LYQNMNNTIVPTPTPNTGVNHIEETNNLDVNKTETKTIKAPGELKKVTTSILLNGNLDDDSRAKIKNLVISAIAYDEKRGDNISIEGLAFDTALQDKTKKDLIEMQKITDSEKKMALYKLIGGSVGALLFLIFIIVLFKKKKGESSGVEHKGIDVLIDDNIQPENPVHYKPIDFEINDEKSHIEKEIKKYAIDKPDQVADIIKSWMAEDER
jgi:flagellar M-ring protein FliF